MGHIGNHDTQSDTQNGTQDDTQDDTQDGTQGVTQDVTQGVTQDVTQGVPQDKELDDWIEKQIRNNSQISTEDLVNLSNRSSKTIKRHLAKMSHIRYVGSGYSGHWEVLDKEKNYLDTPCWYFCMRPSYLPSAIS